MPDFKSEIYRPYRTASRKPRILSHTHSFTLTSAVIGILSLAVFSEVASNMTSRMWTFLIFTLCKTHNWPLSSLLTAIAGLFSMPAACWAFEPHGPCLLCSSCEPCPGVGFSPLDGKADWGSDGCEFPQYPKGEYVPEPEFIYIYF